MKDKIRMEEATTISFDDTDTPGGGCTTHAVSLFITKYKDKLELLDYPLLVRLNPGIPWKTRGNASVVLRVKTEIAPDELLSMANQFILEYLSNCSHKSSSPGIIVYRGNPWNKVFRSLYLKGLTDVLAIDVVRNRLERLGALYLGGRGIIGAAASIAALGIGDPFTYELIAYRKPEYWGKRRLVDPLAVIQGDRVCGELLFSNIDWISLQPLITPHGPDPVLYGIRGTSPASLLCMMDTMKHLEPVHGWTIFRTNQGTSIHKKYASYRLRPYIVFHDKCTVSSVPRIIPGSHVSIESSCSASKRVTLIAYRESYPLNKILEQLVPGDELSVVGSVRPSNNETPVVSVEEIILERAVLQWRTISPRCPRCGSRMKSMGRGKGYRCPRCGFKSPDAERVRIPVHRRITGGRFVPASSHLRHLTRPVFLRVPVLSEFPVEPEPFNPPVNNPPGSNGAH